MVEWAVLDAQWFGVAQRRRRVFALADFGDWANRPPILLESESMRGDSAPSREAGKNITAGTLRSTDGGCDVDHAQANHIVVEPSLQRPVSDVTLCVSTGQAGAEVLSDLCPTLNCNHEAPYAVIPFDLAQITSPANGTRAESGIPASTLAKNSRMHVAYGFQQRIARNGRGDMGDVCDALTSQAGATGKGDSAPCVAVFPMHDMVTRFAGTDGSGNQNGKGHGLGIGSTSDPMFTLTKADRHLVCRGRQVRRLIPRECERLQGFEDDYTLITVRGKPAADGPRYKALGNSMAVPVMEWIGRQIDFAMMFDMSCPSFPGYAADKQSLECEDLFA